MLTRTQYKSLCRFRDSVVQKPPEGFSTVDIWLLDNGLIQPASYSTSKSGQVFSIAADMYCITTKGVSALDEYEEHRRLAKTRILRDIVVAVLSSALALLLQKLLSGC